MTEIFLDVETKRLSHEVPGGWDNIPAFGLALAVTWDAGAGFRVWPESDASALAGTLQEFSRVIGYNVIRFDYAVLSAYTPDLPRLLLPKTTDMLVDLYRQAWLPSFPGQRRTGHPGPQQSGRRHCHLSVGTRTARSTRWPHTARKTSPLPAMSFTHGQENGQISISIAAAPPLFRQVVGVSATADRLSHLY